MIVCTVPYAEMQWVWITDYYDVPLQGLCRYHGRLYRFEAANEEGEMYRVYSLTRPERCRWMARKWLFELAIGRHWSYPAREQGVRFRWRRPVWLWRYVFRAYYWGGKKRDETGGGA